MVEGWGVESEATFPAVLEKTFANPKRRTYFINGGLSGTAPVQYGRLLASVGLKYQPDLVLITVHPNDLLGTPVGAELDLVRGWRGEYEVRAPTASTLSWAPADLTHKTAYFVFPWTYRRLQIISASRDGQHRASASLENIQETAKGLQISEAAVQRWKAGLPPVLLAAFENPQFNSTPISALGKGLLDPEFWIHSLDVEGSVAEAKWASMRHILSDTASLCREASVKCALVYTSTLAQYDPTLGQLWSRVGIRMRPEWLAGQSELERRLAQWALHANVPYLSLTDGFRKAAVERPGFYNFEFDEHWNAAGHELAATLIATWLRQGALVPVNGTRF
jgi:hypothetical protein